MNKTLFGLTIIFCMVAGVMALWTKQYMVAILEFMLMVSFCLNYRLLKQNRQLVDLLKRTNGLLNEIHSASEFDPGANRADVSEG